MDRLTCGANLSFRRCIVGFTASTLLAFVAPVLGQALSKSARVSAGLANHDIDPESRLIEAQRLFTQGQHQESKKKVETLLHDVPNFRAAHLFYGDLLKSKSHALAGIGAVPSELASLAEPALQGLREESKVRLSALRDAPLPGTVPSQFLEMSPSIKHAMAVDASKSRLYLFENSATGMRLISNYYVSVGKFGIGKAEEGDQRTPLGVYFVSRNLQRTELPTLYGQGFYGPTALTLNYPNPLDLRRGKTGGGIWLHGTPSTEYARIPRASDGCVVLSNAELARIARMVALRTTPVVISDRLQWVQPGSLSAEARSFSESLAAWKTARVSGDPEKLFAFYENKFNNGRNLTDWLPLLRADLDKIRGHKLELQSLSFLKWSDKDDTMVVTFTETLDNASQGPLKRQYWTRTGKQWKIFFEGTIG